jgi:hypothetical protein
LSNKNLVKIQHFYTELIAEATSLHELRLYVPITHQEREIERRKRVSIRNCVPSILGLSKSKVNNKGSSFSIPDPPKKKEHRHQKTNPIIIRTPIKSQTI